MACFATSDQPPKYIAYEGPWIVGVQPPDPTVCQKLNATLTQLEMRNCKEHGQTWNGQQCVGSAPSPSSTVGGCLATADKPPRYVAMEGPWVVAVTPPDPSQCRSVPQTLAELQASSCTAQGKAWNGKECTAAYKYAWIYALVIALIIGVLIFAFSIKKQPPKRAQVRFADFPVTGATKR